MDRLPPVLAESDFEIDRSLPVSLSPFLDRLFDYVSRRRINLSRLGPEGGYFKVLHKFCLVQGIEVFWVEFVQLLVGTILVDRGQRGKAMANTGCDCLEASWSMGATCVKGI